jgi:chromosomal replication initiator protein
VDVFLVDDIQFFARKDSSQQEFFHTFNELYEGNKQIVVTSDRQPAELDDLDERLKSRFGMGMVVELLMPDYETRLAILNQKCREAQMIVDPEVLAFIANNVTDSVRALDGVLRQVIAEAQLTDRVPTLKTAAEVIRRLNKAQKIIGFDIEAKKAEACARNAMDVMKIVADYYGVDISALTGSDRHIDIIVPRQVCMYLIKNELGESYEKIGSVFGGKNHTTVMHACSKIANKLRNNIRLVRDVNSIKKEMGL